MHAIFGLCTPLYAKHAADLGAGSPLSAIWVENLCWHLNISEPKRAKPPAKQLAPLVTKLHIASNKIVIAVSGPVSLSQSYSDEIDAHIHSRGFKLSWRSVAEAKKDIRTMFWKHAEEVWKKAEIVARVAGAQAAVGECNHASAAAFAIGEEPHLIQFSAQCNAEEVTSDLPFVSIGSGQPSADPFLAFIRRIFWPSGLPSLIDGQIATVWTLDEVIKTNPGGVGGEVKVAVLKKDSKEHWRCDHLSSEEIDLHRQLVADIERKMREVVTITAAESIPAPPAPPEQPA